MISNNKYYDIEAEINGPYILHKELEKAIMERAERNWLQIAEELNVSESSLHRQILKRG